VLSAQEWRGYGIFVSKGGCASCHRIGKDSALFTDQSWQNTGVAFNPAVQTTKTQFELAPGVTKEVDLSSLGHAAAPPHDVGRFEITNDRADRWAYVTPMLRGVADSWPYMHDGSLRTLEEVIDFYDRGGGPNPALDLGQRCRYQRGSERSADIGITPAARRSASAPASTAGGFAPPALWTERWIWGWAK
jgi:cytochrome c peroxidase